MKKKIDDENRAVISLLCNYEQWPLQIQVLLTMKWRITIHNMRGHQNKNIPWRTIKLYLSERYSSLKEHFHES